MLLTLTKLVAQSTKFLPTSHEAKAMSRDSSRLGLGTSTRPLPLPMTDPAVHYGIRLNDHRTVPGAQLTVEPLESPTMTLPDTVPSATALLPRTTPSS